MLLNYGAGENSWESLGLQGDPTSQSSRKSILNVHWKDWCWSWSSNTLATSCEEVTHWKRPWCWGRLEAGGEGDDRGWDGCIETSTRWTWVWVDSRSWWWTGRPGVLRFMGSQRVGHDWVTEVNWTKTLPKPISQYYCTWKSDVEPRTFTKYKKFIWYYRSPVHGSHTRWVWDLTLSCMIAPLLLSHCSP